MQISIQKWGNSLGLRIPAKLASKLSLTPGTAVEIMVEGDHLVISPQQDELEKLLSQITPENKHQEEPGDTIKGQETW